MDTIKKLLKQEGRLRKIRVAIVDDDPDIVDDLKGYVDLTDGVECAYTTTNPKEILVALRTLKLDVLFLDIEMPIVGGLDILGQLAGLKRCNPGIANLQVVVCSTNREVGDKMYHYEVTDYFLKPFERERYYTAINKVKDRIKGMGLNDLDDDNICFFYGERGAAKKRLNYDEIRYVEAKDEHTWIWLDAKNYIEVNEAFGDIVSWLPKSGFAQVHRSFVVSLRHVIGITNKHVLLPDIEINRGEKGKYKYFYQWIDANTIKGKFRRYGIDRSY
ncbi:MULTISPECIES: LytR/AlgR family response regulator transcription factor [Sphingobacterium]|uniref:LytR/AlgR family response regulator transcription factor n=1 Tax=Sphingobacterium TaxID=28453 RepID=UPI000627CD48|nr:response regulator [Sphingobacterium sp. Ag1]KKO89701.1 hypothetical protein AAW12_19055 [Sphingobacterium sp. Ag1]